MLATSFAAAAVAVVCLASVQPALTWLLVPAPRRALAAAAKAVADTQPSAPGSAVGLFAV